MEVTSYFWGSKGGRGALMEKIIAAAAGATAANGTVRLMFLHRDSLRVVPPLQMN
jgi:hypothetical protein